MKSLLSIALCWGFILCMADNTCRYIDANAIVFKDGYAIFACVKGDDITPVGKVKACDVKMVINADERQMVTK